MLNVLVINASVIAALMLTMWLISLPLKDVSIVDIAWGLGFVVVAWVSYLLGSVSGIGLVIPVLTTVWGLRLSGYLLLRRMGAPEDFRYRNMRSAHPVSFPVRSLLTIFSLQGVLMWIVAMPLQTVSRPLTQPYIMALIGLLLWVTGFLFESVGDWQMARFKLDPSNAGRVMERGLWR